MRSLIATAALLLLQGCTPGAASAPAVAPSSGPTPSSATIVDVNLTLNPGVTLPQGAAGGFAPTPVTVTLGTGIRFHNSDGFAHTASALGTGLTAFPPGSPLGTAALQQFGAPLSQGWSSGTLAAGATSQTLIADQRGTYLFGCFFHYGSPMRGAIVVQ